MNGMGTPWLLIGLIDGECLTNPSYIYTKLISVISCCEVATCA